MKIRLATLVILCALAYTTSDAQENTDYYLPENVEYDPSIPTPEDVFGWPIGKWHVSHDKVIMYMKAVAQASERFTLEEYARSYEDRPLLLATITSPANHKNINKIKADHVALADPSKSGGLKTKDMPVVVYQGYSVHGNEPSGVNAAMMLAYHLAAAKGKEIEQMLDNTIILLDPCYNPDGANRFASWVNTHKSKNPMADSDTREHQESWPRGRTNHYWFDLNRDWLPLQHPESRGRIAKFQEWKPNILTDHHEMGTNNTFFFQPGIPSRTNPLTPPKNQELTGKIAEFHAQFMDDIGSLYYTKESFDDFYYGKGSTYPDAQGCIGILFEQASSRGHLQESVHGDLSFPFTIRNQFRTSLSTLEAAQNLRTELLDFQREFYTSGMENARKSRVKAYIFGDEYDPVRSQNLAKIILQHDIKVYKNTKDRTDNGISYKSGSSYIVPAIQKQARLIEAIFEKRTSFKDSLFYDVSAWTLPLAFNLPYSELSAVNTSEKDLLTDVVMDKKQVVGGKSEYAYLFNWSDYYAPRALSRILENGLVAKVASKPLKARAGDNQTYDFDYGAIMVPAVQTEMDTDELFYVLQQIAAENGTSIYGIESGLSVQGIDLGSPSFEALHSPKALLLAGDGINGYDAGEVWHLLDYRFDIPVSVVDIKRFGSLDLSKYKTLIMADGGYSSINATKLNKWVEQGGTLIGMKGAVRWLKSNGLSAVEFKSKPSVKRDHPYASIANDKGAQYIGGNILQAKLDLTHPLGYGYKRELLPVFRRGTLFFKPANNVYATPLSYTSNPLLAGYISNENLKVAKNSAAIIVSRLGRGRVIAMSDNPNFRAFWHGTNKLFLNALFFGHTISSDATESTEDAAEEEDAIDDGHGHQH